MYVALDLRCLTVSLIMPYAVELYVCIGFGLCGCPISYNKVMINSPPSALMNRHPNPVSGHSVFQNGRYHQYCSIMFGL